MCTRWRWRRDCRSSTPGQEIAQHGNKRQVGRGHGIVAHVLGPDPFQGGVMARLRRAVPAAADIERHQKAKRGVSMRSKGEWRETGLLHRDAELLAQLADQRLFRALAGFDLAAREFP